MDILEIIKKARSIEDQAARIAFLDGIRDLDKTSRIKIEEALSLASSNVGATRLNSQADGSDSPPTLEQSITGLFSEYCDSYSPTDNQRHHTDGESKAESIAALSRHLAKSELGNLGRVSHFEILEIIGQGAFGIVCVAQDTKLERKVAIKFLDPELSTKSPPRKRFLREARLAAATKQGNIVSIHSVEEDPIPYIVMEYVSGPNLQQQLDLEGPLEVSDSLCIAEQIAKALSAAHGSGLVHRDIKPANILVETRSPLVVKLTDFGLARAVDDFSMTRSGVIAGTPLYMSPEQITGATIDGRSDLFSCGSVLYQILSGRPPFRASSTLAVLKRVSEDAHRPLKELQPEIPDRVCRLVNRLLEKRPQDRFQTADELLTEIKDCSNSLLQPNSESRLQKDISQHSNPDFSKVLRSSSLRRGFVAVAVSVAALLCIIAYLSYQRSTNKYAANVSNTLQAATLVNPVPVDYLKEFNILEFENAEFPIFEKSTPEFSLAFTDKQPLFVHPVYQVSQDHEKLGVEKWRLVPESGAKALKTKISNSLTLAQPSTGLSEGVYGVFSQHSAEKPIPDFAGLFAVKGICRPKIDTVQTSMVRNVLKVKLGIRNVGAATFRKGILIAVLTADGNRFCDRQNIPLPEIPPNVTHQETIEWMLTSYSGREYFCHGHVNFRYHYDDNSLSSFRTDPVSVTREDNQKTEPSQLAQANTIKIPANLSLYLKPYNSNEHGVIVLSDHHVSVNPNNKGMAANGGGVADLRVSLFVTNSSGTFSPAVIRLDREAASKLADKLKSELATKEAREEVKDPMTVMLSKKVYSYDENEIIHLPEESLHCVVLPAYSSVNENNERTLERRITLVLQDTQNDFWPLIIRMNDSVVGKMIEDLQSSLMD